MSFFFALVFMILVFWRPQEWLVPELYGFPLLDVVVVLSFLAFLVEWSAGRVKPPAGAFAWLFTGLFLAALMSQIAWTYWAGLVATFEDVSKMCFFAILLYCVTDRPSRLRATAVVFVVMACLMAVHALMQQYYGYGFAYQRPMSQALAFPDEYMERSLFFGIFEDPNDLAQIFATSIPFAFVVRARRGITGLLIGAGVTVLLVAGILATHSRGGMIALAVVGIVMLILFLPRRWMIVLLILLALAGLVLCAFAGLYLDVSGTDRVAFWGQANWAFKERPLFGVGYGMLSDYIAQDRAIHNAFVMCYAELGVLGYWFWFTLIVTGIMGAWRTRVALQYSNSAEGQYLGRFAGLAIAATLGFLVSGYFLSRAYAYPLFFLLVLLNAVPLIAQLLLPERSRPLALVWRDVFVYGTIGTVGSIAYIYVSILMLNKAAGG